MISHVEIQNFRSLRRVSVPMRPLTVLIGPNDSGKSTFLDALSNLAHGDAINPTDHWQHQTLPKASVKGRAETAEFHVQTGSRGPDLPVSYFRIPPSGVAMQSTGFADGDAGPLMQNLMAEVPSNLDWFLRRDRPRFDRLTAAMRERIPGLVDIEIATPNPQVRRLVFKVDNGFRIDAEQASTGVRVMTFFLTLAFHPAPTQLVLLEEPETGLHPHRLADVISLLREMTIGKFSNRPVQIVLTTHSPYLLDCIDLETDQVLVFRRNPDGSRTAEPADKTRLATFLDEFKLGEVWFNREEAALVAKQAS